MSKEQNKQEQKEVLDTDGVIGILGPVYWITPYLRYAKKHIPVDEQSSKCELRLQQMWQGQDGSQKWEWVEVFE